MFKIWSVPFLYYSLAKTLGLLQFSSCAGYLDPSIRVGRKEDLLKFLKDRMYIPT